MQVKYSCDQHVVTIQACKDMCQQ